MKQNDVDVDVGVDLYGRREMCHQRCDINSPWLHVF